MFARCATPYTPSYTRAKHREIKGLNKYNERWKWLEHKKCKNRVKFSFRCGHILFTLTASLAALCIDRFDSFLSLYLWRDRVRKRRKKTIVFTFMGHYITNSNRVKYFISILTYCWTILQVLFSYFFIFFFSLPLSLTLNAV